MLSADIAFFAAVVIMTICNFYFGPGIRSATIPMQWSFFGEPTWYAPKLVGLWGPVIFIILIRLFICVAAIYTPDKVHRVELGIYIVSIIGAAVHIGHLIGVSKWDRRHS